MSPALRETLVTAGTMMVFSVVGATLLSGTFKATFTQITASEEAEKIAKIGQVLTPGSFDNDLLRDTLPLPATPALGLRQPGRAYVARHAGHPVAVVLETVAPDGYSGDIRLLVGIRADGRISGVRVTAHRETPGLGDYIEAAKSRWIRQFDGKALDNPPDDGWKVRKDGGRFDYMAGATITPRAVVKAVHNTLRYFQSHRGELLPAKAGAADKP